MVPKTSKLPDLSSTGDISAFRPNPNNARSTSSFEGIHKGTYDFINVSSGGNNLLALPSSSSILECGEIATNFENVGEEGGLELFLPKPGPI